MAFTNRVRLPFKLHKPQFQEESERYRKANGETVTLSVVIRKIYEGITDEMPEKLHERLKIALAHDNVVVEGDRYVGVIAQEGDYNIEWSDFLSRPIAQAKFKAEVTPFNATNSNCGTCIEYTQIVAVDDDLGTLNEDTDYVFDPLENDSICCFPVAVTLVTFNSDYIDSVVVLPNNNISFHTKTPLPNTTDVTLLTYRAECDSGMYDEANVIADLSGSGPTLCNPPTSLIITDTTDTTAQISWTAASPAPADGYYWEVRALSNLGIVVQSGTTAGLFADVTGLTQATGYRFYVRSDCGSTDSSFTYIDFTTNPTSGSEFCGHYHAENTTFVIRRITWIDCNGDTQNVIMSPFNTLEICAMQTSPGAPVLINAQFGINVTYVDLC